MGTKFQTLSGRLLKLAVLLLSVTVSAVGFASSAQADKKLSPKAERALDTAYLRFIGNLRSTDIEVRFSKISALHQKIVAAASRKPKSAALAHLKEYSAYNMSILESELAADRIWRAKLAARQAAEATARPNRTNVVTAPKAPTPAPQPVPVPPANPQASTGASTPPQAPKTSGLRLSELKSKAKQSFEYRRYDNSLHPLSYPSWFKLAYMDSSFMAFQYNHRKGIEEDPTISEDLLRQNGADLAKPYYVFEFRTKSEGLTGSLLGEIRSIGIANADTLATLDEIRAAAETRYLEDRTNQSASVFSTNIPELANLSDPYVENFAGPDWKRYLIAKTDASWNAGRFGKFGDPRDVQTNYYDSTSVQSSFSDNAASLSETRFFSLDELRRAKSGVLYELLWNDGNKYGYSAFVSHGRVFATGTMETIRTMAQPEYARIRENIPHIKKLVSETTPYANLSAINLLYLEITDSSNGKIDQSKLSAYRNLQAEVDAIVGGKTTDDEKIRAIFDWIVKNIKYDEYTNSLLANWKNLEEFNKWMEKANPDVYSGIKTYANKSGVCMGYARLFSLMLSMSWISDQEVVQGVTLSGIRRTVGHAWNRVGTYYYDPTWWAKWFKLTKEQMYSDRKEF